MCFVLGPPQCYRRSKRLFVRCSGYTITVTTSRLTLPKVELASSTIHLSWLRLGFWSICFPPYAHWDPDVSDYCPGSYGWTSRSLFCKRSTDTLAYIQHIPVCINSFHLKRGGICIVRPVHLQSRYVLIELYLLWTLDLRPQSVSLV